VASNQAGAIGKTGKFGDLWRRLWFLLGALVVYRIGAHIPVPGIDPVKLAELFQGQQGGILGVFNLFSGGALSRFTLFALGHHALHFLVDHHAVDGESPCRRSSS
jgi:preprotein translocase subunit SecY